MNLKPLYYQTDLPTAQCVAAITAGPWEYGDELTPLWYHCDDAGEGRLVVTFRGGKFRKAMETRYLLTARADEDGTVVALEFLGELWGLPPMTPIADVDLFMTQKLRATRIPREKR